MRSLISRRISHTIRTLLVFQVLFPLVVAVAFAALRSRIELQSIAGAWNAALDHLPFIYLTMTIPAAMCAAVYVAASRPNRLVLCAIAGLGSSLIAPLVSDVSRFFWINIGTAAFSGLAAALFCAVVCNISTVSHAVRIGTWVSCLILAVFAAATIPARIDRSMTLVIDSAKILAGAEPYCIQVFDTASDYREARTISDFSEWNMRAPEISNQHHAVLVVGDAASEQLFHWSYRQKQFVRGISNPKRGIGIACVPRQNFTTSLSYGHPNSEKSLRLRLTTSDRLVIPIEYQPRWRNSPLSLYIIAPSPDFKPINESWDKLSRDGRRLLQSWITIDWNPNWLIMLMKNEQARYRQIPIGKEYGLDKMEISSTGSDGKQYSWNVYSIIESAENKGSNTTYISCGGNSCQHRFLNEGRHYSFEHRVDQLSDWKVMQQRILSLFDSFKAN